MKQLKKKIISVIVLLAMVLCVKMPYASAYSTSSDNGVATGQYADWKNNAIVYPEVGQLVAAGPIYLQWNKIDNAAKYYVYIDNQLQGSVNATNENVMEYEVYSTSVTSHTVKVVAELKDNTKITANIRTFYISKKGMGSGMVNKVQESGLSWYYHWSTDPVIGANPKMQFVPMLWGNWGHDWLTNPANKKYKTILGFNEPDFTEQSNVSVDAAIAAWPDFMNSELRVSSPATAIAAPWSSWFRSFMDKVNGDSSLNVDFIAVHCYLDGTYPDTFLQMIDDCYQKYHKPIWITEFGIAEWSQGKWNGNDPSAVNQVSEFMKKVLPELDKRDYVERYAWFPFDPTDKYGGASGLYNVNTGNLNSLGLVYRGLGNPNGYVLPNLDGSIISGSIPQDIVVDDGLGNETIPIATTRIEAENYSSMSGVQTEACNDTGNGSNIGWINSGDWMEYTVQVPQSGTYKANIRAKGWNTASAIQILADGNVVTSANLYTNNDWNTVITNEFNLPTGTTKIRLVATNGDFNLNWFELEQEGATNNDDTISGENLALDKNATVSSTEGAYIGTNAVDVNTDSRWSSNAVDNQWISVDLGSTKSISKVSLNWETAYSKGYKIEVSTDGSNWSSVYQTINSDGGEDQAQFNSVNARHVRVYGTERATGYGISLWELGIYQ